MTPAGTTLLVVEDEQELREYLVEELEDLGYQVCEAGNGALALALLRERPVDLVLTDIMMPQLGGADLYHATRREPALADLTGRERLHLLVEGPDLEDRHGAPGAARLAEIVVAAVLRAVGIVFGHGWEVGKLVGSVRGVSAWSRGLGGTVCYRASGWDSGGRELHEASALAVFKRRDSEH